ncbi:MAG: hypothetical protein OWQ48_04910 [Desulfurococcus sp.]|nr:hypothetical protein [Desulfurococcus sp.]
MIVVRVAGREHPIHVDASSVRVSELLEKLGFSISEHIVLRSGIPLTEDDVVGDGEEVLVYPVKSGG